MNLREKVIYLLSRGYEEIENLKLLHRRLGSLLAVVMMKRDIAKHDVEKMMEKLHLKCEDYGVKLKEEIKDSTIEKEKKIKESKETVSNLLISISHLCEYSEKLLNLEKTDKCCLISIESSFQEDFKKIADLDFSDLPVLKLVEPIWDEYFQNHVFGHLQTTVICETCGMDICACHKFSSIQQKKTCNKQTQTEEMSSGYLEEKKRKLDPCISLGLDRLDSVAGRIYNFHMKNSSISKKSSKKEFFDLSVFKSTDLKQSSIESLTDCVRHLDSSSFQFQEECMRTENRSDFVTSPESNLQKSNTNLSSICTKNNESPTSKAVELRSKKAQITSGNISDVGSEAPRGGILKQEKAVVCITKQNGSCKEPRISEIFQKAMSNYNESKDVPAEDAASSPKSKSMKEEDWESQTMSNEQQVSSSSSSSGTAKPTSKVNVSEASTQFQQKAGTDVLSRLKQNQADVGKSMKIDEQPASAAKGSPKTTENDISIIDCHIKQHPGEALNAKYICSIGQSKEAEGKKLRFPIGVTTNSKGEIVIADTGNQCMKIFNMKGECVTVFGKQHKPVMSRPSAIITNNNDDIFVKDDHGIHVFDKNGKFLRAFGHGQLFAPYGLGWTPEGYLVVLDAHLRKPSLLMYSQKGEKLRQSIYRPLQYGSPLSKCRFLALSGRQVIVTDLGLSAIYVTSLDGIPLAHFGRYGNRVGEFREPSGVAVDAAGNILIADSKNDRIQVFNNKCNFRCVIKFSKLIGRPSGIHLTKDGHLLVVNYLNATINVYKLEC